MWKPSLALALAGAIALATFCAVDRAAAAPLPQEEGFVSLFDGETLGGWRANENQQSFSVVEGKIVVKGPRSHLFYEGEVAGAEFENFVFRAEALTLPGANSGVFFHTRFQAGGWPSVGYEAQVNSTHGDSIKSGSLYNVVKVNPAPSRDGEWFTLEVRVRGQRITIRVDDRVVVDHLEPANAQGTRKLSRGTFALQAHDPGSEVHFRNLRVKLLPPGTDALTRADRYSLRPQGDWWNRMDYGPFLSSTVGVGPENLALKGITTELNPDRSASMTFDTELLRMAAGWGGPLKKTGTPFDGRHGGWTLAEDHRVFTTPQGPGWAHEGSFEDPRSIPHGPLPREWAKYRGLYRHGDSTVFSYTVGSTAVLEMPSVEQHVAGTFLTRNFSIGARDKAMLALLAEDSDRSVTIHGGKVALLPASSEPAAFPRDQMLVLTDRSEGDWDTLMTGAPSADDLGKRAEVFFLPSHAPAHGKVQADGTKLTRVNDSQVARNRDDPPRSTFFDGGPARLVMDLGKATELSRINTFSWHRTNRSPQHFTLWGTSADELPTGSDGKLKEAGWTRIADVDSRKKGEGGKHVSSITSLEGSLGRYRYLLWHLHPASSKEGVFISEIDVFGVGQAVADLQRSASEDARTLTATVLGEATGVRLQDGGDGRLLLAIDAGSEPLDFKVAFTKLEDGIPLNVSGAAKPRPLSELCKGGPALYPELVVTEARLGQGKGPYLVDDIEIPFDNPWGSWMRIGGFDFFADGDRAALCTWNGDVWVISGLAEFKQITWKRYATGLFETLGLCIVGDVVYVNGKDQITRLHDLNGDGEADFYECFNNDVMITRNFHEFTFDLQTDAEGNFYISKGSPVRGGGRGFDKIVPHHGTVLKIAKDGGSLEVYSTGMRAPNGIGVSPDGQLTAGDNEGTWVPRCKIHWLQPGSFQGVIDSAHRAERPTDYNKPLCWLPMSVDNSGGSQVWVTSDRWGPFQGDMLHLSYGKSSIYKVMKDEVNGQVQGGVFKIPVSLASSAMRGRFSPLDGQLYVSGLKGWQTNAARLSGLQRIRYDGKPTRFPNEMKVTERGILLSFTCKLDRELAEDVESYSVSQWNYVWGPMYGSPEVSVESPDPEVVEKALKAENHRYQKHDTVKIASAQLQPDGRSVLLEIPGIRPVMQMNIKTDLESEDGEEMVFDIYNTINVVPTDPAQ